MKKVIRLTESQLKNLVSKIIKENEEVDETTYHDYMHGEHLQELRDALNKNKLVSVAFVKKDGSVRHMLVKRYISTYQKSDNEKTDKQANVEANNDIKRVVDINAYKKALRDNNGDVAAASKACWRTIDLKSVLGFMASGNFIDLRDENDIMNRFGEVVYNGLTKSMKNAMAAEENDAEMGITEDN